MSDLKWLDELERLENAATPGPWESHADASDPRGDRSDWIVASPERVVIRESRGWFWNDPPRKDEADLALCASMRNAAPRLIAEAREADRLRSLLREALTELRPCECKYIGDGMTAECSRCELAAKIRAELEGK